LHIISITEALRSSE